MSEPRFLDCCRRALQEQVAAINATCDAAEAAHRRLCALHADLAGLAARQSRSRRLKGMAA